MKYFSVILALLIACTFLASGTTHAGYYKDAYDAYKAKNFDEAIKILKEGIEAAPNDENLTFLLGQIYLKTKKYDKAIETLKRTVLLDPENDKAYYSLGLCYTMKRVDGKRKPAWYEASQAFSEALKLKPDKSKYLYNYGHSLLELKKYQQAIEPLKKAFATEKGSKSYKNAMDLGIALQVTGDKDEALKYLEKAAELNPKKPLPLKYIGNLYLEKQDFEKVKEIGAKLVAIDPTFSSGYLFQGVGYLQTKQYAEAKKIFEKVVQMDPENALAYYDLGMSIEGMLGKNAGSFQSLISAYGKAVNLSKADVPPEWNYRLGHAYELEAHLDWDRAVRNKQARTRCLRNLRKARDYYKAAKSNASAVKRLGIVNEQIRQLETLS